MFAAYWWWTWAWLLCCTHLVYHWLDKYHLANDSQSNSKAWCSWLTKWPRTKLIMQLILVIYSDDVHWPGTSMAVNECHLQLDCMKWCIQAMNYLGIIKIWTRKDGQPSAPVTEDMDKLWLLGQRCEQTFHHVPGPFQVITSMPPFKFPTCITTAQPLIS